MSEAKPTDHGGRRRTLISLWAVWLLPTLVMVTLALGLRAWIDTGATVADSLYRSAALFAYNDVYGGGAPTHDWRILVGRWTGLAAVFGAAGTALAAVLQERLALAAARFLKQEVVVIGAGALATKAFDQAFRSGRSVLWLGAPSLGVSNMGAIALPWPPEDAARAVYEHCRHAEHVLLSNTDDALSLTLVRAARAAAPRSFITVLMRDARLAEDAAATLNQSRTRVLSRAAISARALHQAHPPFLLARAFGHQRIHAVIVGFGQAGQAIARDLIVNCRTTYLEKPRITVIDPQARALEGVMRLRAPEIDECAEFVFVAGRVASEAIEPDAASLTGIVQAGGPMTAAYICLAEDAAVLASAGMVQSMLRSVGIARAPIFVRLRDANALGEHHGEARGLDALTPFGDLDAILAASEFLSRTPDAAARSFSAAYRAALAPEVRDDPKNTSARPWDELEETFRQANRDAVAHIPAKLASAGIAPTLWRGVIGMPLLGDDHHLFTDEEGCEALARLEHHRWNAQRRMDGWRWTDAPRKDESLRRHPSLVEYDALADDVKEFDRVYVRETERALHAPR
ncbi:RyR domain-containing protein [Caulobacter sp. KR2-114]|uniref:RyR domain-containing protein n=1 Tax=Caulobacter sp. KR2-114 TaxID=3400912 RepID=UPI003C066C03